MTLNKVASLLFFVCVVVFKTEAQIADLARIEYTYFPQERSDNSFSRFRTFANFPIQLNETAYLIPGFGYRNVNLIIRDPLPFTTSKERYQSFVPSLGYTDMLNTNWRFAFKFSVNIASNFEGKPIKDDFIYEAFAFLIKDMTNKDKLAPNAKPWRLILGVSYSTIVGRPFPLPVINYYREFVPNWTYTLGIPKSNIKYRFNNKNALQSFVTLDGFFANIQNNITIPNVGIGENISMTTLLSGFGYEYSLTKNLHLYAYLGYTLINDIRLRDAKGNNVFTINNQNNFYGRTGIKFKI